MNKISKNEKGFSAVEVILILVIVALICVVGYMVYHNHHKTTTAADITSTSSTKPAVSTSTKSTTVTPAQPTGIYAGWKTYTTADGSFSLNYPTDWSENAAGNTCDYTGCQEEDLFYPTGQSQVTDSISVSEIKSSDTAQQFANANTEYAGGTMSNTSSSDINGYNAYYFEDTQSTGGSPSTIQSDVYMVSHNGVIAWSTVPVSAHITDIQVVKSIVFHN